MTAPAAVTSQPDRVFGAAPVATTLVAQPAESNSVPVAAATQPSVVAPSVAPPTESNAASVVTTTQPSVVAPSVDPEISLHAIIDHMPPDSPSARWYVVTKGREPGVYDSW